MLFLVTAWGRRLVQVNEFLFFVIIPKIQFGADIKKENLFGLFSELPAVSDQGKFQFL